ncbi:techylectin-like protein [Nephila pilipes]|uniref:Techylectin-like protein n=1 Tax=Nephila pilipes TaxID=299642 RepID=A0A8X6PA78_NEPPI|nr:techylectin-like protein [Nephila pilipes]
MLIGDALSIHDNWVFYTGDRPNRRGEQDEIIHTGGWWKSFFPPSSLNGLNNHGENHTITEQRTCWNSFGGYTSALMSFEIKLRSKNFKNIKL